MSNYTKATNFATKDALTTGNPLKVLSGTELDDEFNAIQVSNNTKANASNAQLTGVPVAPTAAADTNTTQLATTAFVTTEANLKADVASPTFTGVPAGPTASADTSTTQLATTAFVTTEANLKADKASNLSDLANAGTARTNLGVAIGSDVQAHDADTAKTDVVQTFSAQQTFTTGANDTNGNIRSGRKNLIINGAMTVAQESTTGTLNDGGTGFHSADMFRSAEGSDGTSVFTVSNDTDAPKGFSNSTKWDCTTADTVLTDYQQLKIEYRVEAQDLQHLNFGTSDALQTTLSFWIKSNKTGTYVLWIYQTDDDRQVQCQYTIDVADTWEYKTCLIPSDTTGVIDNDIGEGIRLTWCLGTGTEYNGGTAPTSWEARANANRFAGQTVNLADSTDNYMNITGVQLEVGSVATDFEHVSYGETLVACRRYFWENPNDYYLFMIRGSASVNKEIIFTFPTKMRAVPTVTSTASSGTLTFYADENAVRLQSNNSTTTALIQVTNTTADARLT